MITITTSYNGKEYLHKYKGNILMQVDGDFITITALWAEDNERDKNEDELTTLSLDAMVFDCYFIKDIKKIEGTSHAAK